MSSEWMSSEWMRQMDRMDTFALADGIDRPPSRARRRRLIELEGFVGFGRIAAAASENLGAECDLCLSKHLLKAENRDSLLERRLMSSAELSPTTADSIVGLDAPRAAIDSHTEKAEATRKCFHIGLGAELNRADDCSEADSDGTQSRINGWLGGRRCGIHPEIREEVYVWKRSIDRSMSQWLANNRAQSEPKRKTN